MERFWIAINVISKLKITQKTHEQIKIVQSNCYEWNWHENCEFLCEMNSK